MCNELEFTTFLHKGVAREISVLQVYCPSKPQGCDWQGELGQVEKHLNPEDKSREKGCGFIMVRCRHKCGGWFQRRLVKKHETEKCHKRPDHGPDLTLLVKKLDALATENQATNDRIEEMKRESEISTQRFKKEIAALKGEIGALKAENSLLKCQIDVRPLPPVPPFYFSIPNFQHYKDINHEICSSSFYSHLGGYKLRLEVYPNGGGPAFRSFLSLYVNVLPGEYDDKLKWPFKADLVVEMFNWSWQKWAEIGCVHLNVVHKPAECFAAVGSGFPNFMTSHQLSRDYLHNDLVRFRVGRIKL